MDIILERVIKLIVAKNPRAVSIDGGAAGGKSTLAALLAKRFGCGIAHMDDFFLTPERKTAGRLSEPGGNVDYERFRREVTDNLLSGGRFVYSRYDCKTELFSPVEVCPEPFAVVEGAYSLHPALRDVFDLKIFLRIQPEEQRRRILERNGEDMLKRFENEWIPLENIYFERLGIEKICDIVIDT